MKTHYDFSRRKAWSGAQSASGKDPDAQCALTTTSCSGLQWARAAGGGSYQTLLNGALREYTRLHTGAARGHATASIA